MPIPQSLYLPHTEERQKGTEHTALQSWKQI